MNILPKNEIIEFIKFKIPNVNEFYINNLVETIKFAIDKNTKVIIYTYKSDDDPLAIYVYYYNNNKLKCIYYNYNLNSECETFPASDYEVYKRNYKFKKILKYEK